MFRAEIEALGLRLGNLLGGGHRGLLETEKPRKKALKTAKPQEISSKTENRINFVTHKPLVVLRISLSVLNFNTYKLVLISDILSWLFPCWCKTHLSLKSAFLCKSAQQNHSNVKLETNCNFMGDFCLKRTPHYEVTF